MLPCEKPVGEQTLGEVTNCGWDTLRSAVSGVVSHPGGATVTEWIITTLARPGADLLYRFLDSAPALKSFR